MAAPTQIPTELRDRPFLATEAFQLGLTRRMLAGSRFRRLHRGVYICAEVSLTLPVRIAAALLVLPADTVACSVTALQHLGVQVGAPAPLHFATRHPHQVRLAGVICHRPTTPLSRQRVTGLPLCSAEQAWVQGALLLPFVERVVAADWLLALNRTRLSSLQRYVDTSHQHGVRPARRALAYARERVESPRETLLRLMITFARLPEPQANLSLGDEYGVRARPDLAWPAYRVVVEYDGEHHWRDARQREYDIRRREKLERAGWWVIVVTAKGMQRPHEVVWRVYSALRGRGYSGPPPVFNAMWTRWFAPEAASSYAA